MKGMSKKLKRRLQAMVLVFAMLVSVLQGIPGLEVKWAPEAKAAEGSYLWPVPASQTINQGYSSSHDGLDIGGSSGTPIVAAKSGSVVKVLKNYNEPNWGGYGFGAVISHGDGYYTHYAHMSYVSVSEGQYVSQGQQIGGMGTTGNSTGVHLHFAIATSKYGAGGRINCNKGSINYIYSVAPSDHIPRGFLDFVSGGHGQVSVSGWALDDDNTGVALEVHIYVGGPAGSGAPCYAVKANKCRTDVGYGNYHGFSEVINTNVVGNKDIYAYAINISSNGKSNGKHNPLLSCCPKKADIKERIKYTSITGDATDIFNKEATISGSLSPAGTADSWGFYIGTDADNMQKFTVSASAVNSANMKTSISPYYSLKHGTTYYYKTWAKVWDGEKTGAVKQFTTTSKKPEIPTLKINDENKDIGIGDTSELYWKATAYAESYKMYLKNEDGEVVHTVTDIAGTKAAFPPIMKEGTYTATIEAINDVGTKGESEPVTITVHPDVTVAFMDAESFVDVDSSTYEPETLSIKTVHWGRDALAPADPSHKGYTFKRWNGNYKAVKEDTIVKAEYTINRYKAKFVNSLTGEVLKLQEVEYCSPASPPAFDIPEGYAKTGYDGWDKDYKKVEEDTTYNSCIGWYNNNFPIYAKIVSAVREYDAEVSDNEGYTIVASLKNWEKSTTKGRVVVALKTEEGKLLTSTESSAFSIKKKAEKELEIFVPYGKAASIAEIYVVGQYKDAVPITTTASNNAVMKIDQSATYTNWSTEVPPEGAKNVESRTEYRYSDKSTVESYSTSMSGYTQDSAKWVRSGSGNIDYVSSFPSGFWRGHSLYSAYNKQPVSAYENATNKRTVSTSTAGYLYWHWCRGTYTSGPINRLVSDERTSEFGTFHAFTSGALGYNSSSGAFQCSNSNVCRDTYWWLTTSCWSSSQLPIYKCSYTDYKKLFTYSKWSDYSEWNTTEVFSSNTRKVETRTVYRYQIDEMMVEDNSGEERTVKGELGDEFAGKEAALFIYKVDEASDYTNEYVAQTVLGTEGDYEFKFKLREEPSIDTGDFTVALGIEGVTTPIFLDKIEAPRKEYTVNFYDYNGSLISTETVKEGEAAALPDESKLVREGYTFKGWSDTNVNVYEDKDLHAVYEINKYNVVFVDWEANSVVVKQFEYGAKLTAPQPQEAGEGIDVTWDAFDDGINTVTQDMVVATSYSRKKYQVKVYDFDNKLVSNDTIEYGKAVSLPDIEGEAGGRVFLGWKNVEGGCDEGLDSTIITKNVILCPDYVFTETVEKPVADVKSGVYGSNKTVTLTTATKGASIYYTLDGTNPMETTSVLYTEPIEITDSVELQFYASKAGMNDSEVARELYAINYEGAKSKWMLQSELPDKIKNDLSSYELFSEQGCRYKDIKETTLLSEASSLENSGWLVLDTEKYTEYTDWSDEITEDDSKYVGFEVDTRPVYTAANQYKYSHFAWTDGTSAAYAKEEIAGTEGEMEYTEAFDKKLSIAGFEDGEPYYVYDGKKWYNQTRIEGKVQTGTEYRSRCKIVSYYKWTDYSIEPVSAGETRDYEEALVYSYVRKNSYLVNIYTGKELADTVLVEDGNKLDIEKYLYSPGTETLGVYSDKAYTNEWDYKNDIIDGSMDIYIKNKVSTYTVTFYDNDGEEVKSETVEYGSAATPPDMPEIKGYVFSDWNIDDYLNVKYDMQVRPVYIPKDEYATVELDNSAVILYEDKSVELSAIVTPAFKSDTELIWSSSNEEVAVVSSEGKVTAVSSGTAVIRVTIKETKEYAECNVTVKNDAGAKIGLLPGSSFKIVNGYVRNATTENNTVEAVKAEFVNSSIVFRKADGTILKDTDKVGTGTQICLMSGDYVVDRVTIVITGDIDGDGAIGNRDVSKLARMLADKEVGSNSQILAGDANGDGEIGNRDVALIARVIVGKDSLR